MNEQYAVPVPQEDVVRFSQEVERVAGELRANPQPLLGKAHRASEFVLANYSPAREEQDIVGAWRRIVSVLEPRRVAPVGPKAQDAGPSARPG